MQDELVTKYPVDGVPTSLAELGYIYVGLDDHWQNCTRTCANGTVIPSWHVHNDFDYENCVGPDFQLQLEARKPLIGRTLGPCFEAPTSLRSFSCCCVLLQNKERSARSRIVPFSSVMYGRRPTATSDGTEGMMLHDEVASPLVITLPRQR